MKPRRGFTLVELLAVIAIIGLLIALLLPAVQATREAGRRLQCSSNLRNLATATMAYHEARLRFPPSGSRTNFTYYTGFIADSWSWIARSLPYMEQQPLYDKLGVDSGGMLRGNQWIAQPLPIGFCPSDSASSLSPTLNALNQDDTQLGTTPMAWTNYKGVMGSNWCWGSYPNAGTLTDCGGSCCDVYSLDGKGKGDGILFRTDILYRTKAAHVTDGLSNTFLVGEDSPFCNPGSGWPYASHAVVSCAMPPNLNLTGRFGRWADVPPPVAGTGAWWNLWQNVWGFHSRHPGGLQFANADTSVAFVSDSISLAVYRARSTKAGQDSIGAEQ